MGPVACNGLSLGLVVSLERDMSLPYRSGRIIGKSWSVAGSVQAVALYFIALYRGRTESYPVNYSLRRIETRTYRMQQLEHQA